jgi:hypothetical protein
MFISTPFIRLVVGWLHRKGQLDQLQYETLIQKDLQLNIDLTIIAVVTFIAYAAAISGVL